jgi:hypothetical protein
VQKYLSKDHKNHSPSGDPIENIRNHLNGFSSHLAQVLVIGGKPKSAHEATLAGPSPPIVRLLAGRKICRAKSPVSTPTSRCDLGWMRAVDLRVMIAVGNTPPTFFGRG